MPNFPDSDDDEATSSNRKVNSSDEEEEEEVGEEGTDEASSSKVKPIPPEMFIPENSQFFIEGAPPEVKLAGLLNQGATCYLNSLLQSLFMTPEFRNAVFRWVPPENEDKEKSIPYQLGRLFALLQTRQYTSCSTKPLTTSFGWDRSEAFEQHDVQELCRVLFDALEVKFKGTPQDNLINRLYQGELVDYVRCLECNNESQRVTPYLDIALAIRSFGSTTALTSVMEGIDKYVEMETLDGNNQYSCEKCNKKVNAEKGLKFKSFPYLLTLQLKRFDYDYSTMRRIKLNDRVVFPLTLDLRKYVDTPEGEDPPIYELFSVMIHSGSAWGGHYFAYIRSFENGKWYDFNDSHVSEITTENIKTAYGVTNQYGGFSTSTNCYMLFYRQISPKRNESFIPVDKMPRYVQQLLKEEGEKAAKKKAADELEKSTLALEVHFFDPRNHEKHTEIAKNVHNSLTAAEVATQLCADLNITDLGTRKCRLRKFVAYRHVVHEVLDPAVPLADVEFRSYYHSILFELSDENGAFDESPNGTRFSLAHFVDATTVHPGRRFAFQNEETVRQMRVRVAAMFGVPSVVLLYSNFHHNLAILHDHSDIRYVDDLFFALAIDQPVGEDPAPSKPSQETPEPGPAPANGVPTIKVEEVFPPAYSSTSSEDAPPAYTSGNTSAPAGPTPKILTMDDVMKTPQYVALDKYLNLVTCNVFPPESTTAISLTVDQRITVEDFKVLLEPLVKLPSDQFKVFYQFKNSEYQSELSTLSAPLSYKIDNGTNVHVKVGKALKLGEHKVDVYVNKFDECDDGDQLAELNVVIREGMSIKEFKEHVCSLLKEQKIEMDIAKMRVMTKFNPRICTDEMLLKDDIAISNYLTFVVTELPFVEPKTVKTTNIIRSCRWRPSTHVVDPAMHLIFESSPSVKEFKERISKETGIALENVEVMRVIYRGSYMSVLDIQADTDWNRYDDVVTLANCYPVYYSESYWMFFRDKTEPEKELTAAEKETIKKKENASTASRRVHYSRQEKGLKIKVHTGEDKPSETGPSIQSSNPDSSKTTPTPSLLD